MLRKNTDKKLINQSLQTEGSVILNLLAARGIYEADEVHKFFNPDINNLTDPFLYSGIKDAVQRINEAVKGKEKIVIYGDYDCDGISAAAILWLYLTGLGADVSYYIPNRHTDGYGLNREALDKIAEERFPDLLITVDCGISAKEEVQYLREELGVDCIVTDHHELCGELPDCIVINPKLNRNLYTDYCGAGVVILLITAMSGREEASKYFDIAAIATIGDIVPLTGDNRIITALGIKMLNSSHCRFGLKNLINLNKMKLPLTSEEIAFKIIPRINALGRVGDAARAVSLYISDDYWTIECLIKELNDDNLKRQEMCDDTEKDVLEKLGKINTDNFNIIILHDKAWDIGVLGIIAARIAEKFYKPVILLTTEDNVLKGSARSIDGINIFDCICSVSDKLLKYGGHRMAAGLSLRPENLEAVIAGLTKYISGNYEPDVFEKVIKYDIEYPISAINIKLAEDIERFAPFGEANERPVFLSDINKAECKLLTRNSYSHIKANVGQFSLLGFNKYTILRELNCDTLKQILYTIEINEYNKKKYIQGIIRDLILKGEFNEESKFIINLHNREYNKSPFQELSTAYEIFAKIYKLIDNTLKDNPNIADFYSLETLLECEYNRCQLAFCFFVFTELGIIKTNNNGLIFIDKSVKADLKNSELYKYYYERIICKY